MIHSNLPHDALPNFGVHRTHHQAPIADTPIGNIATQPRYLAKQLRPMMAPSSATAFSAMFDDEPNGPVASGNPLDTNASSSSSHFSALDDICKRIDRSNSWVYEKGIVPMFDPNGVRIETSKTPPWPWEILPDPVVRVGKKAWLTSDIDEWLCSMRQSMPACCAHTSSGW
jgi:hypothetical protein